MKLNSHDKSLRVPLKFNRSGTGQICQTRQEEFFSIICLIFAVLLCLTTSLWVSADWWHHREQSWYLGQTFASRQTHTSNKESPWQHVHCDCDHSVCNCSRFWVWGFLTSCPLAPASAVPERHQPLGESQTLWRRERGDTHSHTSEESTTRNVSRGRGLAGLTDMCSVWDDQPVLPSLYTFKHKCTLSLHRWKHIHIWYIILEKTCVSPTFSFAFILLCLFKQAGKMDHDTVP